VKSIQYFSDDYLAQCRDMTPDQIIRFLDDFRQLQGSTQRSRSRLISLKVPENLLNAFKLQAQLNGVRYQTQIKQLMGDWVRERG